MARDREFFGISINIDLAYETVSIGCVACDWSSGTVDPTGKRDGTLAEALADFTSHKCPVPPQYRRGWTP